MKDRLRSFRSHRAMDAVMRAFVGLDLPEKRRLKEASDFDVLTTLAARTARHEGDELAQARPLRPAVGER